MAFVVKDGVSALRFETSSTASMLFRHVDLDLADYQFLTWRQYMERTAEVDLREIYRHIWPDGAPAHLIDIAIFCDSEDSWPHRQLFCRCEATTVGRQACRDVRKPKGFDRIAN